MGLLGRRRCPAAARTLPSTDSTGQLPFPTYWVFQSALPFTSGICLLPGLRVGFQQRLSHIQWVAFLPHVSYALLLPYFPSLQLDWQCSVLPLLGLPHHANCTAGPTCLVQLPGSNTICSLGRRDSFSLRKFLEPHLLLRAVTKVRNAKNTMWVTLESAGEMQWSSIAKGMLGGMKGILNRENIPFKYFSWQLDLTPPRTAGSSSVKTNKQKTHTKNTNTTFSLSFLVILRGYLIPLFLYPVVLLLSQHMQANMAQPQFADGMMSRGWDCWWPQWVGI